MLPAPQLNAPLLGEEVERLDDLLQQYGKDYGLLSVDELDGYLTAIVSGPHLIRPNEWYPEIWGGRGFEPDWEKEADYQDFMVLTMRHINSLIDTLMGSPENYEPILSVNDIHRPQFLFPQGWCKGYLYASELWGVVDKPETVAEKMAVMAMFFNDEGQEELSSLTDEEYQALVAQLGPAASDIFKYWIERREPVYEEDISDIFLTEDEIGWLEDILMKYGTDDSVLCMAELDGFCAAVVSSPNMIYPDQWYPALWNKAGNDSYLPDWEEEEELHFLQLVSKHMVSIETVLVSSPEHYEVLLPYSETEQGIVYVAEEWAFGYMRGVDLCCWPDMPEEISSCLYAISLHGREDNFDVLEALSLEEHQQTVAEITPAVIKIYQFWSDVRKAAEEIPRTVVRDAPKVGRNEPCPCGSGKKYKQCCLH